MNRNIREQLRKFQLLLINVCAAFPLPLLLLQSKFPPLLDRAWIFPAVFLLLAALCIRVSGKWRMMSAALLCAGFVGGSLFLSSGEARLFCVLIALYYSAMVFASLQIGGWGPNQEVTVFWMAYGMVAHLAGQIALYSDSISADPVMGPVRGWMLGSLFLFVLLVMLSQNRKSLTTASGKRQRASEGMRQKNTLLTVALFLLAMAVSFVPSALRLLRAGLLWLWRMLARLAELLSAPSGEGEVAAAPSQDNPMAMMGEGEIGAVAALLEKIIIPIGICLVLAALGYLAYRLWKLIRRPLARLWALWSSFAAGASEDYVDEIISTRDNVPAERIARRAARRRLSQAQLRAMPPAERIRYRYRRLLGKNAQWQPGSTARETIPESAAVIYERARYSTHPVTEEDDQHFAASIE